MRISDWSSDVCSSDLPIQSVTAYRLCSSRRRARWGHEPKGCRSNWPLDRPLQLSGRASGAVRSSAARKFWLCDWDNNGDFGLGRRPWTNRSEEHTSELQSLMRTSYAVFCLQKKTHISKKITQR